MTATLVRNGRAALAVVKAPQLGGTAYGPTYGPTYGAVFGGGAVKVLGQVD